jgi:hypothetical protein
MAAPAVMSNTSKAASKAAQSRGPLALQQLQQAHGGSTITISQTQLQGRHSGESAGSNAVGAVIASSGGDTAVPDSSYDFGETMMISGGGMSGGGTASAEEAAMREGGRKEGEAEEGSEEGGSDLIQTVFSIVNISIGPIGMLGVPFCFKECGWLAVLALFVMAVAMLYTALLLDEIQQHFPHLEDYLDIGEAALGPRGRIFVTLMVFVDMLSTCCTYLIVEGTNLYQLHPDDAGGWTPHRYILTSALVVLPTCWIKNLNGLTRLNVLGSVIS